MFCRQDHAFHRLGLKRERLMGYNLLEIQNQDFQLAMKGCVLSEKGGEGAHNSKGILGD